MDDRHAHSRAANSAVQGQIWLKFELIQDVMVILVTSKNEENPIKIEGARVATIQNIDFSNTKGAGNSAVSGRIWPKFELIQDIEAPQEGGGGGGGGRGRGLLPERKMTVLPSSLKCFSSAPCSLKPQKVMLSLQSRVGSG